MLNVVHPDSSAKQPRRLSAQETREVEIARLERWIDERVSTSQSEPLVEMVTLSPALATVRRALEGIVKQAERDRRDAHDRAKRSKIERDVKDRAAVEVAEIIAAHVPADAWDGLKANLYAAGASNIANALANITGHSITDARYAEAALAHMASALAAGEGASLHGSRGTDRAVVEGEVRQ